MRGISAVCRHRLPALLVLVWAAGGTSGAAPAAPAPVPPSGVVRPFETDTWPVPLTPLDTKVLAAQARRGVQGANPCSDEVFVRRIYLDVIGTLPDPQDAAAFVADRKPDKRAALIEKLLVRPEFADYWAVKWGDLLRIKAEFPVNLWPNAAQAYDRWVRESLRANKPYDQFARELLTSSGSNYRVGPANFYRAVQGRDPAALSEAVALTLMGSRAANWPPEQRAGFAAFFSRIAFKKTGEWKEEIVCFDPAPQGPLSARFPDGQAITMAADQDPRAVFADWLLRPGNPWFAKNIVNRVWSWLLGRGIISEADDIRPDNPPANPELLAWLEHELVAAHYDLRTLYRLILNSRTYQQSAIPRSQAPEAEALAAWYPVRRLDAEVLADALELLTGKGESYSSPIPEPFTWIPDDQRAIELPDGSITGTFLEMFGRPARDTGLEAERSNAPTDSQRLYLLNAGDLQRRLDSSARLRGFAALTRSNRPALVRGVYLTILSREPTAAELALAEKHFQQPGQAGNAATDLAWALINTKEFLYRH